MCAGHAGDNYRHVKIHLISVSIFSGWWAACEAINALITANRRNNRERPAQTPGKDPQT